jgi:hypothetical protein
MIGLKVSIPKAKSWDEIRRDANKAGLGFLQNFGMMVRWAARDLTKSKKPKPNPPGQPWNRGSNMLRNTIYSVVNPQQRKVEIGFIRNHYKVAELHEFGGYAVRDRKRRKYPARPVINPAFSMGIDRTIKKDELMRKEFRRLGFL